MPGPWDAILAEISQRLKGDPSLYAKAVPDLKPRITGPGSVRFLCPKCNHHEAWCKPGYTRILCPRQNNCGIETDLLGQVVGLDSPPGGKDRSDAIKHWCAATGTPYDESKENRHYYERFTARRTALETVWQVANESLDILDPLGDAAVAAQYLYNRAFEPAFVRSNFGYIGRVAQLSAVVVEKDLIEIGFFTTNALANSIWNNRIIIPGKDTTGRLVGFVGRSIDGSQPKYLYTHNYHPSHTGGLGLETAKKYERVVLVEGSMDVLKARQHGIFNLIAAGQNTFSASCLHHLALVGVREVVACLDADGAGQDGLFKLLEAADKTSDCPELYVIDLPRHCEQLGCQRERHCKDADEFIDCHGPAVFVGLPAIHGLRHRARSWARGIDFTRDGAITRYIERCIRYSSGITDKFIRLRVSEYFLPELADITGLGVEGVQETYREHQAEERKKQRGEAFRAGLSNALQLATKGDAQAAQLRVVEVVQSAQLDTSGYVSRIPMGPEIITQLEDKLRRYASREFIGLPNYTLKSLDWLLCGLRGFTLLAGGTNVGKTMLLSQLATDIVQANEDACVLFLSLEMQRSDLLWRMWSNMANISSLDLKNQFGPEVNGNQDASWDGRAKLNRLRQYIRIWHPLEDGTPATEEFIRAEIDDLRQTTQRKRCMVIIDYFDVLPIPPGFERATRNEVEHELCGQMLRIKECIGEDNPLLCVSEMRKRLSKDASTTYVTDDVMGAARKQYSTDCDLLWHSFSDKMLWQHCELLNDVALEIHKEPRDFDTREEKKPEFLREVARTKQLLGDRGLGFGRIEVAKVRDGGRKGTFDVTVDWRRNKIMEGLQV